MSDALALRPAFAIVAERASGGLPGYVTREQARAIIDAAATTTHRLLLGCFWQTGGRVSEVLALRPCDVDDAGSTLTLANLKQKGQRARRRKVCVVSRGLVAQLKALQRDAHLLAAGYYFRSQKRLDRPMTRQYAWTLITKYAERAGVYVPGPDGVVRPASGLNFRHGAAIHLLRSGKPLTLVQEQLGHARIDTTTIYTKMSAEDRRQLMEDAEW